MYDHYHIHILVNKIFIRFMKNINQKNSFFILNYLIKITTQTDYKLCIIKEFIES